MSKMIENNLGTVLTGIFTLLGVGIGLLFPAIIDFVKYRLHRKKATNKIISSSLEIWFIYHSANYSSGFKILMETLKKHVSGSKPSEIEEKSILDLWDAMLKPIGTTIQKRRIEAIKIDFNQAVVLLSEYAPILAFRLRGMDVLYEELQDIDSFLDNIKVQFMTAFNDSHGLIQDIEKKIQQSKDVSDVIKATILSIALRYHLLAYFELNVFFWKKERYRKNEIIRQGKKLAETINKMHNPS